MGVPDRDMLRKQLILGAVLLVAATEAVWKPKGNMHAHEHPDRLFRNGDKNKDDKLDAAELKDFYTHDKATAALDTNKDGFIDANEFLAYASPAHALAVAEDDFDLSDVNKDGLVEIEEYKKTHYGKERVIGASHDGFLEHFTDIDTDKAHHWRSLSDELQSAMG